MEHEIQSELESSMEIISDDVHGIEGNKSAKLNVSCSSFPVEMLDDNVWMDRLDYEEAEASYQLFLHEKVKNAVSKASAQTQTAVAKKPSINKHSSLPDEMMHDSVWINRLEYEEAEANCLLRLNNNSTMGFKPEREDVSNLSSSSVEASYISKGDDNNSLIHSDKVESIEDNVDSKMENRANGCFKVMEPGSTMDLNDFNGLKAAVIQLTQAVSTLSKENVKLKNRLENNEARMKKIANNTNEARVKNIANNTNTTPTLKVVEKKMAKIETRVQKIEQKISCMNSLKPYPYDSGQLNAVQLDNLKQQLLIVCHRGNQNVMELIRKVDNAQKIDKQQFDGAMQSLRTYLQHKESEHTEDLVKLKGEMEDFVNIKNRSVEELKKSIKKQKQVDDEARIRLQKRIEKIEMTFNSKPMNMPDVNKKGAHSDAGSYASSISSVCDEKPAAVCSANDSFNKVFSGVNMVDYVGQTNDYLQYFQQMNSAELPNGNAKVSNTKSTVSASSPVASWTKVSESMPIVPSVPRVKYSEMLSQSSSSQQALKSMFDGAKVASSSQLNEGIKLTSLKLSDPVVHNWFQWKLPKRKETATEIIYHSIVFLTGNPGYRAQLRAQIDRLHGDIYFSIRLIKGVFDNQLTWPFPVKFVIRVTSNSDPNPEYSWTIPKGETWTTTMIKPTKKKEKIFSEWIGPFDITNFLERKHISLEFMPVPTHLKMLAT